MNQSADPKWYKAPILNWGTSQMWYITKKLGNYGEKGKKLGLIHEIITKSIENWTFFARIHTIEVFCFVLFTVRAPSITASV